MFKVDILLFSLYRLDLKAAVSYYTGVVYDMSRSLAAARAKNLKY